MKTNLTVADELKVFVVEDSALVRERLVELIREVKGVDVVGEAGCFSHKPSSPAVLSVLD